MNRAALLIRRILLVELLSGMWITLKNLFRPHITMEYPREKPDLAPRFRGVPRLRRDPENGEELCVGCLLCEQICPDDCISIVVDKRPTGKGKMAKSFIIDYERCCYCGLCVDPCPTTPITAIYMSHDYELSDYSRVEFITAKEALLDGTPLKRYAK
jgi:NADH-quinone oxidoreductase subunit I